MTHFIKQKGFTLIELLLVLGIATIMSVAAVQASKREGEYQTANAAATQMNELSSALVKQITKNYPTYIATPRATITIADLQASKLLPAFYINRTPFGGSINMEVVSSGGAAPALSGLITTTPWTDPAGNPRYDLLGSSIKKIGALGGVTYYSTNTIAGLNGGWSAVQGNTPNTYTFITAPGQLAVRVYVDATGADSVYLRRDGLLPMLGNLDLGFHDINNAVNISAQGWVYANHIASNDATIGSIFSNYIRNTGGIDTAQITGIGSSSVANFEYLTARTKIDTPDIVVTNTTTTGKVQFIDTVVLGSPCPTNGLAAKDSLGFILSCQSGIWGKQSKPAYTDSFTGGFAPATPSACSSNDLARKYTLNLPTASTVLMQLWTYAGGSTNVPCISYNATVCGSSYSANTGTSATCVTRLPAGISTVEFTAHSPIVNSNWFVGSIIINPD